MLVGRTLCQFNTNITSTNSSSKASFFQSLFFGGSKLVSLLDRGKPKAELVGEVMASASGAVTFDKRCGPEVFQAGTWTGKGLSTTLGTSSGVLENKIKS